MEAGLVSAEHLRVLHASATTDSATQPRDEAIGLAATDTALYQVVFYNNLSKLQSPPPTSLLLVNLLQGLNMSILTGYPAKPCQRPKPSSSGNSLICTC